MSGNKPDLLPCPFCGGVAHLFGIETIGASVAYFVKCVGNKSKCAGPIRTKYCDTKERATEVWNTRAERTALYEYRNHAWHCTSCGDVEPVGGAEYCPTCGAHIVGNRGGAL